MMILQILEGTYHQPLRWFSSRWNIWVSLAATLTSTPFNILFSSLRIHSSVSVTQWMMCHMQHNTRSHSVATQSKQNYHLPPSKRPDFRQGDVICLCFPSGHITMRTHWAHLCPFILNHWIVTLCNSLTVFLSCLVDIHDQILWR